MTWRVIFAETASSELDRLPEVQRIALSAELMTWVESGPPRINRREVAGAALFEDRTRSGHELAYFVNEAVPYVAILRIRTQ